MILVAGATGFLGKRVCRLLKSKNMDFVATSKSLGVDLRDRQSTINFMGQVKPDYVLNCAAYVGGIQFGLKHPAELFHNNLMMTLNLLEASKLSNVKRIVNPISNCAYPGEATFFKEKEFWNGPLHESVMVYGFARKASWVGSWAYAKQYNLDTINLILSNMYGPEDHFDEERSHALGALIMKIIHAKENGKSEVVVWGTGKPIREWLHVDDAAEAMVQAININSSLDPINIGIGIGTSISETAEIIKDLVGYKGKLLFDTTKLDGAPCKIIDGSNGLLYFGWQPNRKFKQGIAETIEWYMNNGDRL
jgi:GDP-L-fucose synthase